jgi:hypothetical protein
MSGLHLLPGLGFPGPILNKTFACCLRISLKIISLLAETPRIVDAIHALSVFGHRINNQRFVNV